LLDHEQPPIAGQWLRIDGPAEALPDSLERNRHIINFGRSRYRRRRQRGQNNKQPEHELFLANFPHLASPSIRLPSPRTPSLSPHEDKLAEPVGPTLRARRHSLHRPAPVPYRKRAKMEL